MNWENQYLEEDPREREQYLWVSIFYFMMKGCRDDYGLEKYLNEVESRHANNGEVFLAQRKPTQQECGGLHG